MLRPEAHACVVRRVGRRDIIRRQARPDAHFGKRPDRLRGMNQIACVRPRHVRPILLGLFQFLPVKRVTN